MNASPGPSEAGPRRQPAVDVCVVGSGASGLPVATRLAQHGFRVVVLERGPWMPRAEFLEDELLVRRGLFWPTVEDEPRTWRPSDDVPAVRLPTHVQLFANAMVVGGSTIHYSALAWRFRESDFRVLTEDGPVDGTTLADWPIRYEDLEPYYSQAEWELGVSGDTRLNPWEPPRGGEFPLPPVARNSAGAILERGARALGLHPFPIPLAILSRDYDGRSGCTGKGFCSSYGCPTGARSSTMEAFLPKGLATGRLELRPNAFVTGVETDDRGRATGVTYIAGDGSAQRQEASIVVLAAGGVETTRLLLLSTSAAHPDGLANGSGLVGKNLMQHSPPATVVATFPQPLDGHMGTAATRTLMDWYATDTSRGYIRGGFAQPRAHGGDPIDLALRKVHPATWGLAHKTSMRETWRHYLYSHVTGESLPVEANRVDLDPEVRDRFGLPVARVTYTPHENDDRLAAWIADRSAELFEAAGATKVYNPGPTNRKLHNHQMGTARMGDDPATSVVDRWCRAHECPNLYIADSSVFVTSAGVNPSLTITAIALRIADRIAATRGDPAA
jgi:choline dehydrogenase-like flavoprotein